VAFTVRAKSRARFIKAFVRSVMRKLERKRKGLQLLLAPFSISGIVFVTLLDFDAPFLISTVIAGIVLVSASVFIFKSTQVNAAWIENDTLKIRGGFSTTIEIPLKNVQYMRYVTGERHADIQRDALFVKMRGFDEWEIPVTDKIEHLSECRLYEFIKNNFYDLPYHEQVN
jgi:hypothetical protein